MQVHYLSGNPKKKKKNPTMNFFKRGAKEEIIKIPTYTQEEVLDMIESEKMLKKALKDLPKKTKNSLTKAEINRARAMLSEKASEVRKIASRDLTSAKEAKKLFDKGYTIVQKVDSKSNKNTADSIEKEIKTIQKNLKDLSEKVIPSGESKYDKLKRERMASMKKLESLEKKYINSGLTPKEVKELNSVKKEVRDLTKAYLAEERKHTKATREKVTAELRKKYKGKKVMKKKKATKKAGKKVAKKATKKVAKKAHKKSGKKAHKKAGKKAHKKASKAPRRRNRSRKKKHTKVEAVEGAVVVKKAHKKAGKRKKGGRKGKTKRNPYITSKNPIMKFASNPKLSPKEIIASLGNSLGLKGEALIEMASVAGVSAVQPLAMNFLRKWSPFNNFMGWLEQKLPASLVETSPNLVVALASALGSHFINDGKDKSTRSTLAKVLDHVARANAMIATVKLAESVGQLGAKKLAMAGYVTAPNPRSMGAYVLDRSSMGSLPRASTDFQGADFEGVDFGTEALGGEEEEERADFGSDVISIQGLAGEW